MSIKCSSKDAKMTLCRSAPNVLTVFAVGGLILTSYLSIKATPKAIKLIKDSKYKHEEKQESYTKFDAVRASWRCYIPATMSGFATVICIIGINVSNKQRQAALVSAYTLIKNTYSDYTNKVKELYGTKAHQKIIDELAVERAKNVNLTCYGICNNTSLDFDDFNPDDIRLFYDAFSKRYFESTVNKVIQAEYHMNRNFVLSGVSSVNEFYDLLGLDNTTNGDEIGWDMADGLCWIDFNHHKTILDDGLEVYVLDMEWVPTLLKQEYFA